MAAAFTPASPAIGSQSAGNPVYRNAVANLARAVEHITFHSAFDRAAFTESGSGWNQVSGGDQLSIMATTIINSTTLTLLRIAFQSPPILQAAKLLDE